jgi:hypothetical protein
MARASYLAFFRETLQAEMQANAKLIPLPDKVVRVTDKLIRSMNNVNYPIASHDELFEPAVAWASHVRWNDRAPWIWMRHGLNLYEETIATYSGLTAAEARELLLSRDTWVHVWTPLDAHGQRTPSRAFSYKDGSFKFEDVTAWKPNKPHINAALAKMSGGSEGEAFEACVSFAVGTRDHHMFRSPDDMLAYAAWWAAARHEFIQKAWAPERHQAWCLPIDEL